VDARLILATLLWLPLAALGFDHQAWDALLKRHVVLLDGGKASQLRYAGMASDRAVLKTYLQSLSAVTEEEFDGWPRQERMAFLINAYNAFTVEKILGRYPDIGSIWDFGKLFGNPFKEEFFTLLGDKRSLDWIEHENLRKRYREPRIHYAVNCASVGCPMLREEAYAAARLEAQLEEQARRFLSDRSRNRLREGRLEVSKIFDWFRQDFEPRDAYFARYANLLSDDPKEREAISRGKILLRFLDYDWSLNDAKP
jgi:Protein of unknown function, DUF547